MPFVGMQVSHRGNSLCCVAKKSNHRSVKEFWQSDYLRDVRSKMSKGEQVGDCNYCYKAEEQGKISLRNHYNSVYKKLDTAQTPTAMDLDFSNLCNLQCVMCGPDRSSQWSRELGNKKISHTTKKELDDLCGISNKVRHLNIQGGEPSLMPEFEYYFQYLKEKNLIKNIELDCISNLTNINNKFYQLLNDFKSVNLNASIDSFGRTNDYIRYPSNFKKIEQNLLELSEKNIQINLQITLQILSMFNFSDFLHWINDIQIRFHQKNKILGLNLFYVEQPSYLCIQNASKKLKQKFIQDVQKFIPNKHIRYNLKFMLELKNLEKTLLQSHKDSDNDELISYINILDTRRNIKITNYIPDFYEYL